MKSYAITNKPLMIKHSYGSPIYDQQRKRKLAGTISI